MLDCLASPIHHQSFAICELNLSCDCLRVVWFGMDATRTWPVRHILTAQWSCPCLERVSEVQLRFSRRIVFVCVVVVISCVLISMNCVGMLWTWFEWASRDLWIACSFRTPMTLCVRSMTVLSSFTTSKLELPSSPCLDRIRKRSLT